MWEEDFLYLRISKFCNLIATSFAITLVAVSVLYYSFFYKKKSDDKEISE